MTSQEAEEFTFELALRQAGVYVSRESAKITYRIALLIHEKQENATIKDIQFIVAEAIEETRSIKEKKK